MQVVNLTLLIVLPTAQPELSFFQLPKNMSFSGMEVKGEDRRSLEVKRLYVYPIKSCGGISLESSAFTEKGLMYDRHWIIVDSETHKFVTARQKPQMVMIQPSFVSDPSSSSQPTHLQIVIPPFNSKSNGQSYPRLTYRIPLNLNRARKTDTSLSSSTSSSSDSDSDHETGEGESFSDVEIWHVATDGIVVNPSQPIFPDPPSPQEEEDIDFDYLSLSEALSLYLSQQVLLLAKGPNLLRRIGNPSILNCRGVFRYLTNYVWPEGAEESELLKEDKGGNNVYNSKLWETGGGRTDFADGFPFLVAGWESFVDLVRRRENLNLQRKGALEDVEDDQVEEMIKRFRPNIVLGGTQQLGKTISNALEPWEEDGWFRIEIQGEGVNKSTKWMEVGCVTRCSRCQIPNINPFTGISDSSPRNKDSGAIRDMTHLINPFRKVDRIVDKTACVGINGVPRDEAGFFKIGNKVRILSHSATRRASDGFFARPEDDPTFPLEVVINDFSTPASKASSSILSSEFILRLPLTAERKPLSFMIKSNNLLSEYRSTLKFIWVVALMALVWSTRWRWQREMKGDYVVTAS